jgi:hypothetical protein
MRKSVSPNLITRRKAIGSLLATGACGAEPAPKLVSSSTIMSGQSRLVTLPNRGSARLSLFDVATTAIDHISGPIESADKTGDYYPASNSPAFKRLNAQTILSDYQKAHGQQAQALINCSFFERYDPITELSFPIKQAGRVITGGSSPYGPRANPADPRYKNVRLKALVWNDRTIQVVDYDHLTGGILNDPTFPDGLVTYDYKDHPANVLAGDPVGQYQLLGTFATRDGGLPDVLFVLTIIKGRMVEGAAVLKQYGVSGPILTVDGGPSTHLWTAKDGVLIATESKDLPHYLGFRART